MPYPTVTADELREIAEMVKLPDEDNAEFQRLIGMLIDASPKSLGYTAHTLLCRNCGTVRLAITPVPWQFPALCYECGEYECYIHKTAGEE